MNTRISPVLNLFIPPYRVKPTEVDMQAADIQIERWKGDHHARNDAQALRLQVAQQHRDNWSATQ